MFRNVNKYKGQIEANFRNGFFFSRKKKKKDEKFFLVTYRYSIKSNTGPLANPQKKYTNPKYSNIEGSSLIDR